MLILRVVEARRLVPAFMVRTLRQSPKPYTQVLRVVEAKRVVTPRFWIVRILPIGLFMALTLHFGNLVYLYLTVAFIQMLKVRMRISCGRRCLL